MGLRRFWDVLEKMGRTVTIEKPVDPYLEMAAVIHHLEGQAVRFTSVCGADNEVVAGLCSHRDFLAAGLGIPQERLLFALAEALAYPQEPPIIDKAPCQEVVETGVDLGQLPILTHLSQDGGAYVTAGVAIVKDPDYGQNMAIHRLMRLDERCFGVRVIKGRGTSTAYDKVPQDLEMAVCIGNDLPVLLAAAMSPPKGVNELTIAQALGAQALGPTPLVQCQTVDLVVPAEAEFVLEGRLTHEMVDEGPFLDLTETTDIVRRQPVFTVDRITHRREPIYQALLAGGQEHKLLMGVPREPTIYAEVNKVCDCQNVLITPGGASWLHAVVQIHKGSPDDGQRAIEAAFRGHSSLKHVVVVDEDIDIYDLSRIEWAIATRFQASRDLMIFEDQPSSSLDPSAWHLPDQRPRATKMGLDATIPWITWQGERRSEDDLTAFRRMRYPDVDLDDYLS